MVAQGWSSSTEAPFAITAKVLISTYRSLPISSSHSAPLYSTFCRKLNWNKQAGEHLLLRRHRCNMRVRRWRCWIETALWTTRAPIPHRVRSNHRTDGENWTVYPHQRPHYLPQVCVLQPAPSQSTWFEPVELAQAFLRARALLDSTWQHDQVCHSTWGTLSPLIRLLQWRMRRVS